MESGPRGSRSIPGTDQIRPGIEIGVTSAVAKQPAFPDDVAVPGGRGSTTVTLKFRAWSAKAQFTPIIPAPITTTCFVRG
jgi:hypothetical protein